MTGGPCGEHHGQQSVFPARPAAARTANSTGASVFADAAPVSDGRTRASGVARAPNASISAATVACSPADRHCHMMECDSTVSVPVATSRSAKRQWHCSDADVLESGGRSRCAPQPIQPRLLIRPDVAQQRQFAIGVAASSGAMSKPWVDDVQCAGQAAVLATRHRRSPVSRPDPSRRRNGGSDSGRRAGSAPRCSRSRKAAPVDRSAASSSRPPIRAADLPTSLVCGGWSSASRRSSACSVAASTYRAMPRRRSSARRYSDTTGATPPPGRRAPTDAVRRAA